jgi:tetratricopeptide (TPR) repeat protein
MPAKTKKAKRRRQVTVVSAPLKTSPKWWHYALALFVLAQAAFLVYGPALNGPFLFDDLYLPMSHPNPAEDWRIWIVGVRPLLMLSYWVNYQLGGARAFSYHTFNVLFHAANALLVFLIVCKVLEFASVDAGRRRLVAAFAGGLFLVHPIQTESVAYVAGRSEALSVLFFFAAFAAFLYRRSAAVTWPVAILVVLLFGAALASKEHTVVLPALLLITDYYWNPGFSWEGIRRNWRLYGLMVLAGAAGVLGVVSVLRGSLSAGFGIKDFTWYQYFYTQCRAFFVYLRLFLFPAGQTIDYDFPVSHTITDHGAIFGLAAIVLLVAAALYFRRQYRLASYGLLVFILLMAPTSSFVPLKDPIAERRLYLSMIGLLFMVAECLIRLKADRRKLVAAGSAVLFIAGFLSWQRNHVWASPTALWQDTVQKSPGKARAHFQLAFAYFQESQCEKAVAEYETAARLQPLAFDLLVDWGLAYDCLHQPGPALAKLQQAAAMEPSAHIYSLIGMVYAKEQKWAEALDALATAEKRDPAFLMTYVYRGNLYASRGEYPAAAAEYRRALSLDPRNQLARDGLALAENRLRSNR